MKDKITQANAIKYYFNPGVISKLSKYIRIINKKITY